MRTSVDSTGMIGFFFPVFGFEHQRYLEHRIKLMQDKPYHVVCIMRVHANRWDIPSECVTILFPGDFLVRAVNKLLYWIKAAWLTALGRRRHSVIMPLGWKIRLRRAIDANGIGAFIIFYGGSAILVGAELERLGIPFAVLFEGSDFQIADRHPWYKKKLQAVISRVDRSAFVSRFLMRQAQERGYVTADATLAYNGTHVPVVPPEYSTAKPFRLVSIGNLFPVKGHEYLLEGFREALAIEPDMFLTIIGGGHLEGHLREMIKSWGIEGRVRLAGSLPWSDAQTILSEAHIFVLASVKADDGQEEALPLAAIEAQSLAKPGIVSDSGGLPEIVEDGVTGIVVPQRDAQAICRAICELVADPLRLAAMSRNAHARAAKLFAIENQARELKLIRDSLLDKAGQLH